jgi:DNA-binding transcriptional LysR family regulator
LRNNCRTDLESLRVFVKVAELASFTRAGEHLGIAKSRVSLQVRQLEAELGTRLLQRTTRVVRPTPEGERLVALAARLLLDADELTATFQAGRALRGRVRVDFPTVFARDVLVPRLPDFIAAHRTSNSSSAPRIGASRWYARGSTAFSAWGRSATPGSSRVGSACCR